MKNIPYKAFDACTVTDAPAACAGSRDGCVCSGHATNVALWAPFKVTMKLTERMELCTLSGTQVLSVAAYHFVWSTSSQLRLLLNSANLQLRPVFLQHALIMVLSKQH
jgi:hypothetical protein